jgi:hypothetical protein
MSEDTICPICLEELTIDNLCITNCKHKFHTSCLFNIQNRKCPLCRDGIKKDNDVIDVNVIDVNGTICEIENDFVVRDGKCIGKRLENEFFVLDDIEIEIEFKSFKLNKTFNESKEFLVDLKFLTEFIADLGYYINKKGVVLDDKNILGKISKIDGKYTINTDKNIIAKERAKEQLFMENQGELNFLLLNIEKYTSDSKIRSRINRLSLICPKSQSIKNRNVKIKNLPKRSKMTLDDNDEDMY